MDCFHPVYVKDQGIYVRCGRCPACLAYRQQAWITRLLAQLQCSSNAYFVTLTYNDEHLHYQPAQYDFCGELVSPRIAVPWKRDVQLFNKRLRKHIDSGFFEILGSRIPLPYSGKMSYYVVCELGPETLRPHYHGIYFNVADDPFTAEDLIRSTWSKGFVQVDECNAQTISYVTKYLLQNKLLPDIPDYYPRPWALMSKGLGAALLTPALLDWWRENPTQRCYVPEHGTKKTLARYYKDKIFDDDMKARIADKYASRMKPYEYDPEREHLQQEYVRQRRNLLLKKSKLK
jgi:hypothetical protein